MQYSETSSRLVSPEIEKRLGRANAAKMQGLCVYVCTYVVSLFEAGLRATCKSIITAINELPFYDRGYWRLVRHSLVPPHEEPICTRMCNMEMGWQRDPGDERGSSQGCTRRSSATMFIARDHEILNKWGCTWNEGS
jgi:hypothetical protein